MMRVPFTLPLDPTHRFTPEALSQLAEKIVGQPIMAGPELPIGRVLSAEVRGDSVMCEGEVDDRFTEGVGYGFDGKVSRRPGGTIDGVLSASVAAIPPSMLPTTRRDDG